MKKILPVLFGFFFIACDKNKELQTYTEIYHIENGDTLSYVFVPNTFTPDWDGMNDYFLAICNGIPNNNYDLKIYNLGGEIIFQTSHPDAVWDGSKSGIYCENGTYRWKILAKDIFDYEYDLEGEVHLLR
jgi:gliding motility-associated-like protein